LVTAADGKAKVNPEAFAPPENLNYTRVKGVNAINADVEFELAKLRAQNARPGSAAERAYIQQTNQKARKRNAEYAKLNKEFLASSNFTAKRKAKLNAALASYKQAKLNNQKALANFTAAEAAAAAPVAAPAASSTGPVAQALGVAGAPGLLASPANNPALKALLAPPAAGLVAPQGLNALGEARRLAAARASGAPLYTGSSSGGKRSRKNRKNRKGSRKNRSRRNNY